jgi:hypothetical protein
MSLTNEDEQDKQTNKQGTTSKNSAVSDVGESIVFKLRIPGEAYERLSALEESELQATQQFLAQALGEYLDRGSPEPCGHDPSPDAHKPESHLKRVFFHDPQQAVIGYALHVLVGQGVGQMLTMNSRDFRRFDGLQIRHPIELS